MKHLIITTLLMVTMAVSAQEEESEIFSYHVPMTLNTYSGDWAFMVQLASDAEEALVSLETFSAFGSSLDRQQVTLSGQVFLWQVEGEKSARAQSVVFQSDKQLYGELLAFNPDTLQINSVPIGGQAKNQFVLPHIAKNYFKWKTSFALVGADNGAATSDVFVGSSNNRESRYMDELIEVDLEVNNFIKRTAYLDVLIGGLDTEIQAAFGKVWAADPDFLLSGYQSFSRLDGSYQTCAIDLQMAASDQGVVSLTEEGVHSFAFANDQSFPVNVTLTALADVGKEGDISLNTFEQIVTLEPVANRVMVLGADLFPEVEGRMLGLIYRANRVVDEVVEGAPIHAVQFVTNEERGSMGGQHFGDLGDSFSTWIQPNPAYQTQIKVLNLGLSSRFTVVLSMIGETPLQQNVRIPQGADFVLDYNWIMEMTGRSMDEITETIFIRLTPDAFVQEESGGQLCAVKVHQTEHDIAMSAIPMVFTRSEVR